MEKLALVIPADPTEPAAHPGRSTAELAAQALQCRFDCTCIPFDPDAVCPPPASIPDVPTYTQRSYWTWRQTYPAAAEPFDAVLAMDGLHPWALAMLDLLQTRRRFAWVCDEPKDYLLEKDLPFFAQRYQAMAGIFCANKAIQESFCQLFPEFAAKTVVAALPLDAAYYRQLAQTPCEAPFSGDTADLVTVCRLDSESDVQTIPRLAAQWAPQRPELRWHIAAGPGTWYDKLLREIVLNDVCETVELLDAPENPAPLIAQANAYLSITDAGDEEAERIARAMHKPILYLPLTEQQLRAVTAGSGTAEFAGWNDQETVIRILQEELQ